MTPLAPFQPDLIHESIYDALRDAVRALGGSKEVGHMLWGAKPIEDAKNRVNDCLNPGREAKFSLDEVLLILRKAKEKGYHGAMHYIAAECGYSAPMPVSPEDERAQLEREFVAAVRMQETLVRRMERLAGPKAVAA